jgi:hypothetical protein
MARFPVVFWPRTLTYVPHSGVTSDNLPAWIQAHYLDPSLFIREHRKLGENGRKLKKPRKATGNIPQLKPEEEPPTANVPIEQNRLDAGVENPTVN